MSHYQIKRIYDEPAASDGYRVLVDRLWPRGVSHERAALDDWLKNIAPSPDLRTWFNHEPAKFDEFSARYQTELQHNPVVQQLQELAKTNNCVTLLYAAHDPQINHAQVLKSFLDES